MDRPSPDEGTGGSASRMLLHNNHDGTFTDVTRQAGGNERWGFGLATPIMHDGGRTLRHQLREK